MERRNVEVFDFQGTVIAGFWQCPDNSVVQWNDFYRYLAILVGTPRPGAWCIFEREPIQANQHQHGHGALCPPGTEIVQIRTAGYILLTTTGEPVTVELVPTRSRPIRPDIPNAPNRPPGYRDRVLARDGSQCLISGTCTQTNTCVHAAHIFPRAHTAEWAAKGFPGMISDMENLAHIGGQLKIDSVQNLLTLRIDAHSSWDNYKMGADPDNGYRITSWVNGNKEFNGKTLRLDHIHNPTHRPLDELLKDHFMQGLFKHMKGAGEPEDSKDYGSDQGGDGSGLVKRFLTLPRRVQIQSKNVYQSLRVRVKRRPPVPSLRDHQQMSEASSSTR